MHAHAADEHPDADLLTAFAEQSLIASERERVLAHLAACPTCREVVSLAMPPEPEPAEVGAPAAHSWFRWPLLRWTAVAATVIVVGAAVSVLVKRDREIEVAVPAREAPAAPNVAEQKKSSNQALQRPIRSDESANKSVSAPKTRQVLEAEVAKEKRAPTSSVNALRSEKPVEQEMAGTVGKLDKDTANKREAERSDAFVADSQKGLAGAVVGGVGGPTGKTDKAVLADQAAPPPPPPPKAQPSAAQNEAVMAIPSAPASARPYAPLEAGAAKKQAVVTAAPNGAPVMLSRATSLTLPRWRVSAAGAVERSTDGNTWEKVEIDPAVTFRAMSSNAGDLWASGTGGALFHSVDAGRSWSRVKVGDDAMSVSETITGVDFPSTRNGVVTTQSGAVWTTQDGGRTWQRKQ